MKIKVPHTFMRIGRRSLISTILTVCCIISGAFTYANGKKTADTFTVVIDAGHGGHDHGAVDNGAREKDINLGVAQKLASLIKKKMKNVKVVMTRDDDTFISLQKRADIANMNKGNLFISIHTNSVDKSNPNRKKVSGTSVYALGTHKSADNLKVARRENSVIELERDYHKKYSGFDPSKDESYIIFEMAQKKNLGNSLKFADKAQKELVKMSGRADRGVKQAGFWVLWATSMPAVLVELDFICNPDVAAYLNSDKGQTELATALFNAFKSYADSQNVAEADAKGVDKSGSGEVVARIDKSKVAETVEASTATDSYEGDEIGTLTASTQERVVRKHNSETKNPNRRSNAPRKRRSSASREISSNRNVETEVINLKSETDYLLKQEVPQEEVKPAPQQIENPKDKKKKKKKEKKPKQKKEKKVRPAESKGKSDSRRSNQKTIVVKGNSANYVTAKTPGNSKTTGKQTKNSSTVKKTGGNTASKSTQSGRPVQSQNAAAPAMVYKVLLFISDTELADNDPMFRGVKPTGVFKENGQYKYTVGSSSSRQEIQNLLFEIRNSVPEASIVVRYE